MSVIDTATNTVVATVSVGVNPYGVAVNEAGPGESSDAIRERVDRARRVQLERFRSEKIFCNAQMSSRLIRKYCLIVRTVGNRPILRGIAFESQQRISRD